MDLWRVRIKRRDLLKEYESIFGIPIPPEPPPGYFKVAVVPNFGELMLASNPSSSNFDATHWWLCEKYDGVRTFYNPYVRVLYSRTGKVQVLPAQFYSALPRVVIDGEIWFGRGNFLEAHKIMAAPELQNSIDWSFLRIIVFDNPDLDPPRAKLQEANSETANISENEYSDNKKELDKEQMEFEIRYKRLVEKVDENPVVEVALNVFCKTRSMLHQLLEKVLDSAGEGIVARKYKSIYSHGRADTLLKFKSNRDQEGLVIDKRGTFYELKLPSDEIIRAVRSPNMVGEPKIGELVTFVYFQHSRKTGSPTWAQIQVVRNDMTWQEAVYNYRFNTLPRRPQVTPTSNLGLKHFSASFASNAQQVPSGYYTVRGSHGNIRKFFDAFARARNLDPLNPESWYSVTASQIEAVKHGYAVVKHYARSVSAMLMDTYPEIGLVKSKFHYKPLKYWTHISNQRTLFDDIARKRGLDPLKAETWYSLRRRILHKNTRAKGIMEKYKSYQHCVKALYPELNLTDAGFLTHGHFLPRK